MPIEVTPAVITKIDEEQRLVFGWFNVAVRKDGKTLEDLQGDIIPPAELEKAAYAFMEESRSGGVAHRGDPVAVCVESMVFTPEKLEKMGLPKDALPTRWWGGFRVNDSATFEQVKKGALKMFSIEGTAQRVEV